MQRLVVTALVVVFLVDLPILPGWTGAISRASADEKESPIVAKVKAAVKGTDRPFVLVVRFKVKEGAAEKFEAAFAKATQETRKEKGNRAYDLNRDTQTPTHYLLYESWHDLAALEAHLKTPYITKLLADTKDLQAGPPEGSILVPAGE
jgi:quinol monooxygenase YgiN